MSSESGWRSIIARTDGGVSVLCTSANRQGAASVDALLARSEANSAVGVVVDRVRVEDAPSDRRLRNAWVIVDGKLRIDLAKARALRARQWVREGAELRKFIQEELLPYARMMNEDGTLLAGAVGQIDRILDDLGRRIHTMTEAELASHVPDWPQLTEGR